MADVRPRGVGGGPSDRRGQLFIVGALALAVLLVTLAMLLNTAIYAGNIATRDPGPGTTAVIQYENEAGDVGGELLYAVNRANNSSYGDLNTAFNGSIANWSDASNAHTSIVAADATVTVTHNTNGTRVVQDSRRNFTDDNHDVNWTLVNDTKVRDWEMDVHEENLTDITLDIDTLSELLGKDVFRAQVTDASGTRNIALYNNSSYVVLAVTDTGGNVVGKCTSSKSVVSISITNATMGGQPCEALTKLEAVEPPLDVSYVNAEKVSGNYSFVVSKGMNDIDASHFYDDTSGSDPYITHAIYSTDLNVTYRSPVITYQTERRVAPGELHD